MLSIFVEASCNRYERDECVYCHVYEPLTSLPKSDWHITPQQAQIMADKIIKVEVLNQLAQQEINLTGGEATFNPFIVDIFKIFQTVSPNVCLHTNLDINSEISPRWQRLLAIMELKGRIDITLYPVAWEKQQKPLLRKILKIQNKLLINIVFDSLVDLKNQIQLLVEFFEEGDTLEILTLLKDYHGRVADLVEHQPGCEEAVYTKKMEDIGTFSQSGDFVFGINLLPSFKMDDRGRRALTSNPFPKSNYLLECVAARGSIDIMTVQQNGALTPCCDVGNLKCLPTFGNLLQDAPESLMAQFEVSRRKIASGIAKNRHNLENQRAGEWVEEGIPPYCT